MPFRRNKPCFMGHCVCVRDTVETFNIGNRRFLASRVFRRNSSCENLCKFASLARFKSVFIVTRLRAETGTSSRGQFDEGAHCARIVSRPGLTVNTCPAQASETGCRPRRIIDGGLYYSRSVAACHARSRSGAPGRHLTRTDTLFTTVLTHRSFVFAFAFAFAFSLFETGICVLMLSCGHNKPIFTTF